MDGIYYITNVVTNHIMKELKRENKSFEADRR